MHPIRYKLILALLILGMGTVATGWADQSPVPKPSLSPHDVVKIQLNALQHNNKPKPDHGIKIVYNFASPENKSHTGPFAHFAAMIHNGYAGMLNWKKADFGPTKSHGNTAVQRVDLTTSEGRKVTYVFVLKRQTQGSQKGCWLTDGVITPSGPATEPGKTPRQRESI